MFKQLVDKLTRTLGSSRPETTAPENREHAIRMATAVLMVDVARADNDFKESEFEILLRLIEDHFGLTADEANELANAADEEAEALVEVHSFTRKLHDSLSEDEKVHVVDLLWKVAYADGRLSKYEDSLILQISDLLYVNRATVMRLKFDAAQTGG